MSEDSFAFIKKRGNQQTEAAPHSLARPLKKLLQVFVEQRHPPAGGEGQLEPPGKPFADGGDTESEWEGLEGREVQCLAAGLTAAASTQ